jgi:hypothetical protein
MDTQEIRDLYEAYLQVHQPQELTEEVEIAAQYFYEMGLNEEGVEILIEELGVEEFGEFVYDIAEEYYLTEARAGGVKVEPVTAKGKPFRGGKPTGKSLERLRSQKAARREAEASASEAKPSGLKASLQRQSAVASAKKQQPKKRGVLDRVAGAVNRGLDAAKNKAQKDIETRKKFMSNVRGTVEVAKKAAGKVGEVAKEVGKGASGAVKFAAAVTREEVEAWVNNLLEEGYDLSEYTWDDMYEIYMEEVENLDENRMASYTAGMSDGARASAGTQVGSRVVDSMRRSTATRSFRRRKEGGTGYSPNITGPLKGKSRTNKTGRGQPVQYRKGYERDGYGPSELPRGNNSFRDFSSAHKEEYDLFDTILEHLVAEGYADTNEAALVIMANMSEEWRESIVEKHSTFGYSADDPLEDFDQFVKKGPKTNKQKRQAIALNKKILSKKED